MAEVSPRLSVTGRRAAEPQLPTVLKQAHRSAAEAEDPFLPDGYVEPVATVDVGAAARSGDDADKARHAVDAGDVIVLELEDGSTFIGSVERLRETLRESHPELIGPKGEIRLEGLRAAGGASRSVAGDALSGLVRKIFGLVVGAAPDAIVEDAKKKLVELLGEKAGAAAELGVSWLGTKALMWAIETRLEPGPGLYRWTDPRRLEPVDLRRNPPKDPVREPMLVFIHGTASSTFGSFDDLRTRDSALWRRLEEHFAGGIYALEHRTMSESPIENAIQLATALPEGAHVSLVSHSRGGLVADLLCLDPTDADLTAAIDDYGFRLPGTGDPDPDEAKRVIGELATAHDEHRARLRELAERLTERKLIITRYVRAAAPASGTKLAGGNIDIFLSGLLTVIGMVPAFFGNPLYSAVRRIVLEIAKNRTNPHLVPGIEAMLPDSPMAAFLRRAAPRTGVEMGLLAGDTEGDNALARLGVLLTDYIFFQRTANDLVVDTPAMLAGVADRSGARVLFDRGPGVSHFHYFSNQTTRAALCEWLVAGTTTIAPDTASTSPIRHFQALPAPGELDKALAAVISRDATDADRPVVIVLPGVMGSHLVANDRGRVWFDPIEVARGGLGRLAWGQPGVKADKLFGLFYGGLCQHLAKTHVVIPFPYDWRQPLDVLAEGFGGFLEGQLGKTRQPIRLLAHSMGGLVVRAAIHHEKTRAVMDQAMGRGGARLVMLGTPHQGSHAMVENLLGKGEMLRTLVALDVTHDMQEVLDIVAGFRGALQLLPKPGFVDHFQAARPGEDDGQGGRRFDYQSAETWADFKGKVRDLWFGHGRCATPAQAVLDEASWLWARDGQARPGLPIEYKDKSVYVFGFARQTACGVREEHGRLKMVGTPHGDGTVTWVSGRIENVGRYYYMPVAHGDLVSTHRHFPAIVELLEQGATRDLTTAPPATRDVESPAARTYDAGPPGTADGEAAARAVLGASAGERLEATPPHTLHVAVKAMDLRFVNEPIMVGQYERDPLAGPQALIDAELLDGDLGKRWELGLYPGPRGTAMAVLRVPNEQERRRGTLTGAVVTGLGEYDGALSESQLTDAVRTGVVRFLLQVVDVLGKQDRAELKLATLLLGYNSSQHLSVADSVRALVRGVLEANDRFARATRLNLRVTHLDIVELYLDTAISATYRLGELKDWLGERARALGTQLEITERLDEGFGVRPRLYETRVDSYWPRLIITDADRDGTTLREASVLAPSVPTPPLPPALQEAVQSSVPAQSQAAVQSAIQGALAQSTSRTAEPKAIAERLRFLYVGQRARAESVMHQRQPGLIEQLIRRQIAFKQWQDDFGRLLFQLMVPPDFKEAGRSLARIMLVVDSYTANLPWELMLADEQDGSLRDGKPLAVRTPVVRQLASGRYRPLVRSIGGIDALVIGNPSVEGFAQRFVSASGAPLRDLPPLDNAEAEAEQVAGLLGSLGYKVETVIGADQPASQVIASLYRRPWRILHISAHGVFQLRHVDGTARTGVVLSDGFLITATEIAAMESVPELVFLNCCHLGAVEVAQDGNRLAASISRELIELGVRCVVVAGWAVDDRMAMRFGQVFYEQLLRGGLPFGDAVFKARETVWREAPDDITWGAFQAYGDPAWRGTRRGAGGGDGAQPFLTAHEVLDFLVCAEADIARRRDRLTARDRTDRIDRLQRALDARCPSHLLEMPTVKAAIGRTWLAFGEMDRACKSLGDALQLGDPQGRVSLRDAEQLANAESRLGDRTDAPALVALAVRRLEGLADLVAPQLDEGVSPAQILNAERASLLGGAYKHQAAQEARLLLGGALSPDATSAAIAALTDALGRSASAYRQASTFDREDPYGLLNWLMLEAVLASEPQSPRRVEALAEARRCVALADKAAKDSPSDLWKLMHPCDCQLTLALLDGRLLRDDDEGKAALAELKNVYKEALESTVVLPSQLDSVARQVRLLAEFIDALGLARPDDPVPTLVAERLSDLAQSIDANLPSRRRRQGAAAPAAMPDAQQPPAGGPRPRKTSRKRKP